MDEWIKHSREYYSPLLFFFFFACVGSSLQHMWSNFPARNQTWVSWIGNLEVLATGPPEKPQEYYSTIKKIRKFCHCDKINGAWGHYAKWNESDRQILYIWPHLYMGKKIQWKIEQIWSYQRLGWRWGEKKLKESGQKVQTSNYKINKYYKCNV